MADVKVRLTLKDGSFLDIDKFNGLKSVESLSQSTGQSSDIFYGGTASSGTLTNLDVQGKIKQLIIDETLPKSNINIDIYENDKLIQKHIGTNSSYNMTTGEFTIDLTNEIENLDNATYLEAKYNDITNLRQFVDNVITTAKLSDVKAFQNLLNTKIVYGIAQNIHEGTVGEYLEKINFIGNSCYNPTQSISELIADICTIAQLNMVKKDNGDIVFISARPRILSDSTIIDIPLGRQFGVPNYDIIIKNKYNNVSYTERNLSFEPSELVNEQISFSDDNYGLDNINGEAVQIIEQNNLKFLCLFKTVESDGEFVDCNKDVYDKFNFNCFAFKHKSTTSIYKYPQTSDESKENINFLDDFVCMRLTKYSTLNSETFALKIALDNSLSASDYGSDTYYSISGLKYTLKNVDKQMNNLSDKYELQYNGTLLQNNLVYVEDYYYPMYELIANNIMADYASGIHTFTISISCNNYYDIDGNLVKDSNKGEIIEEGEIVRICKNNSGDSLFVRNDGSNVYFQVVGRTFRYSSVPMVDLELREVVDETHNPYIETQSLHRSLANDSPYTIDYFGITGQAPIVYRVGDKTTIHLSDGGYINFIILDFNSVNDKISGTNRKAAITLGAENCLESGYTMSPPDLPNYAESYVRKNVLPDILSKLPTAWQSVIKRIDKWSVWFNSRGEQSESVTNDKLWLMGEEATSYKYYIENPSALKKKYGSDGKYAYWWSRYASARNLYNYVCYTPDGYIDYNGSGSSSSLGVVIHMCI